MLWGLDVQLHRPGGTGLGRRAIPIAIRRAFLLLGLASLTAASAEAQEADAERCDPETAALAYGSHPYAERQDRCEGTYRRRVSSGLHLQAVYRSFGTIDLQATRDPLVIRWPATVEDSVRLRADGRVGQLFLRMDTRVGEDQAFFEWDTRILRALSSGTVDPLDRESLTVLGWSQPSTGARREPLYLPLRISHGRASPSDSIECPNVRLMVRAAFQPESVYVKVQRLDLSAGLVLEDLSERELGRLHYPPNRPIEIELPELSAPGDYAVTVSAIRGEEPAARTYLIRLPPTEGGTGC